MFQFQLRNLFKHRRPPAGNAAVGIISEHWPRRIYAIGDIHGRHDLLCALERIIVADAGPSDEESYIVTLGT